MRRSLWHRHYVYTKNSDGDAGMDDILVLLGLQDKSSQLLIRSGIYRINEPFLNQLQFLPQENFI